jgi:hypothetical protein
VRLSDATVPRFNSPAEPGSFHIRRVLTLGSRFTRHGRAGGTAGRPDSENRIRKTGPGIRKNGRPYRAGQGAGPGGQGRGQIKSKR